MVFLFFFFSLLIFVQQAQIDNGKNLRCRYDMMSIIHQCTHRKGKKRAHVSGPQFYQLSQ